MPPDRQKDDYTSGPFDSVHGARTQGRCPGAVDFLPREAAVGEQEEDTVEPRTASGGGAWIPPTDGDGAARRRGFAVAGVSVMGAAAVSTAVFQTVTGTSTSLAMAPGLGALFAVSSPTPQGPAVVPTGLVAPTITDLGPSPAPAAPSAGPQVDLRAQRGPLPGPGELGGGAGPAASVPLAAAPAPAPAGPGPVTAAGSGGGGSSHDPGSSWPGAPGAHGSTTTRPTPPAITTTPPATTRPTPPPTTRPAPPSTRPTRPHPPTSPKPTHPAPPPRSTTPPPSSTGPAPSSGSSGPARSGSSGPSSGAGRPSA
jgi:hypothetical protein